MYRFDHAAWPIVVVRHDASHTEEEFDDYLRELERLMTKGEKYVIVDVIPASSQVPSLDRIKRFARWYEKHKELGQRQCLGAAAVIHSAAMRGAANFFVQLIRSTVPRYIAREEADAMAWARTKVGTRRPSIVAPH